MSQLDQSKTWDYNLLFKSQIERPRSAQPQSQRMAKTFTHTQMMADRSITPGPGTYNLNQSLTYLESKENGFTFGIRPISAPVRELPGPATYNYKRAQPQYPTTLKSSEHCKIIKTGTTLDVGPGSYIIRSEYDSKKGIKFSSRYNNLNGDLQNPGPGAYNTTSSQKTGFSFGSRHESFGCYYKGNDNPPVGIYNVQRQNNDKSASFKYRTYKTNELVNNPGPGQYIIPSTITKRGSTLSGRTNGFTY